MRDFSLPFFVWAIIACLQAAHIESQLQERQGSHENNAERLLKRSPTKKVHRKADKGQAAAANLKIDYCQLISVGLNNKKKISTAVVRNCYKSFQYDKAQASQTVDTVSQLLEMYAFLDYNNGKKPLKIDPDKKYSNPREEMEAEIDDKQVDVSSGYNLKAAVEKVGRTTYKTDFEFQEALASALIPARDGHLSYRPNCYRKFTFIQPVYLVARLRNNKLEVILGGIDGFDKQVSPKHLGSTVVRINGEDAIEHLVKYAREEYGRSRSAPTRFARVTSVTSFDPFDGDFRYERGDFARRKKIPDKDGITYSFRNSATGKVEDVTVSWRLEIPDEFNVSSHQDYWNKFCKGDSSLQKKTKVLAASDEEKGELIRNLVIDEGQGFLNSEGKPEKKGGKIKDETEPVVRGPGLGFFILKEDGLKFGVISVPTFEVRGPDVAGWAKTLANGLNMFRKEKIEHILVDFFNNGGGNVCLAHAFARTLSMKKKKFRFPYPNEIMDSRVRVCPLLDKLCDASLKAQMITIFTPGKFNCVKKDGTFTGCSEKSRWSDKKVAEKEELRLRASPVIVEKCPEQDPDLKPLVKFEMWTPNVYLLTNGYCGSACATALAVLRYEEYLVVHFHHKTPCFGMSQQECNSKAPFSFAGGQVLNSTQVFSEANKLNLLGKPDFPVPFKTNAEFSFAYRALIDRQYPLDLMHWDRDYISFQPGYSQMMRVDKKWKESLRAVEEYKTKRKSLLEFRKQIRTLEAKLNDLEAECKKMQQLYTKQATECEKEKTQACVDDVNKIANKIENELNPKNKELSDKYNIMIKELAERSQKESKEFGKHFHH